MAELPAFITNIPEETLSPQRESDEPARINQVFTGDFQMNTASEQRSTLLSVPNGYVFEVTYINIAVIALSAPVGILSGGITTRKKTDHSTGFHDPMFIVQLNNNEHDCHNAALPRYALMINDATDILVEFRQSSGTGIANMKYILVGNLIKKEEISKKTNIIL